jgi:hypothetical protein
MSLSISSQQWKVVRPMFIHTAIAMVIDAHYYRLPSSPQFATWWLDASQCQSPIIKSITFIRVLILGTVVEY